MLVELAQRPERATYRGHHYNQDFVRIYLIHGVVLMLPFRENHHRDEVEVWARSQVAARGYLRRTGMTTT